MLENKRVSFISLHSATSQCHTVVLIYKGLFISEHLKLGGPWEYCPNQRILGFTRMHYINRLFTFLLTNRCECKISLF